MLYICKKTAMGLLGLTQKITPTIIKAKMQAAESVSDYKRWQIIYHICCYNVDADYLSDITGYSKPNIYKVVQQFNNSVNADISIKPKGGRKRAYMSIENEKKLLRSLESKALQGQILTFKDIQTIIEHALNKPVSADYIWDLFKRNGWTKHTPRPSHPHKKMDQQEAFKKNSKTSWIPLKRIAAPH